MSPRGLLVGVVLVVVAFPSFPATAGDLSPSIAAEVAAWRDHLQELDRRIEAGRLEIEIRLAAGEDARVVALAAAASLRRHLHHLELQLDDGVVSDSVPWRERLGVLRARVESLERSARITGEEASARLSRRRSRGAEEASTPTPRAAGNETCETAMPFMGVVSGNSAGAAVDGPAACGFSGLSPDLWYRFTATTEATLYATTAGSLFDTVLSVYDGCPAADDTFSGCADGGAGLQSALDLELSPGREYFLRVSGFAGAAGAFRLAVAPGGTITGQVRAAATGQPLAGVPVRAENVEDEFADSGASTDATGTYRLGLLEPGTYRVMAEFVGGFIDQVYHGVDCPASGCDGIEGNPVEVQAGQVVSGIDFSLAEGGRIEGVVRAAASGDPIADARVVLDGVEPFSDREERTDREGRFVFSGLAPGVYYARAGSAGFLAQLYDELPCANDGLDFCEPSLGTPIPVGAAATITGIDFELVRGGTIEGKIIDATSGEPLDFLEVFFFDRAGRAVGSTASRTDGSYRSPGLAPGRYTVATETTATHLGELWNDHPCTVGSVPSSCDVTRGEPVTVALETSTPGIDFALERSGAISGRVIAAQGGAPLSFIEIEAYDLAGNPLQRTHTSDEGHYRIGGLPPGRYRIATRATVGFFDEAYDDVACGGLGEPACATATAATLIEVGFGAEIAGIDFALDRAGGISGRIVQATGGQPIAFVDVEIRRTDGTFVSRTSTGTTGLYLATSLGPGSYTVATATEGVYLDEVFDDVACFVAGQSSCAHVVGTPVQLARGQTLADVDFELRRAGAIVGRVLAAGGGVPISRAEVEIYRADGQRVAQATTDDLGRFELGGLLPGSYRVLASAAGFQPGLFGGQPCPRLPCDVTPGQAIEVQADSTRSGVDVTLMRFGRLEGRVLDERTGAPLVGINVAVELVGDGQRFFADTDAAGRYFFADLETGAYVLAAGGDGIHLSELYDEVSCGLFFVEDCLALGGTPVAVQLAQTVSGIDFRLERGGEIRGVVRAAVSGQPLGGVEVELLDDSGTRVASRITPSDGGYGYEGLLPGRYFIQAARRSPYLSVLWDGVECPADLCPSGSGTPIDVEVAETVAGVDFSLRAHGVIAGTVRDGETGTPIRGIDVVIFDAAGAFAWQGATGEDGGFRSAGLAPGLYHARTTLFASYAAELYPELACPRMGCEPTAGAAIRVELETTTPGIDFTLDRLGLITGSVRNAFRQTPVDDLDVLLWSAEGELLDLLEPDALGRFVFENLGVGTYYVATSSIGSYADEVYAGLPCPDGGLGDGGLGGCDPTTGTPIVIDRAAQAVQGIDFALVPIEAEPCDSFEALCLAGERFMVEVEWKDFLGLGGRAEARSLTDDSGYFWFLDEANVEVVVKVLDACGTANPGFWVFAAGLTNFEVTTRVTDLLTGEVETYRNPAGKPFQPILDTRAFQSCSLGIGARVARAAPRPTRPKLGDCEGGDHALCLAGARFQVEARFRTFQGESGIANAVALTDDAGYFWFFDDDNVEAIVKVLDGCSVQPPRFWVFAAGLTNVEVVLRVTDTENGQIRQYTNPLGAAFQPILDTAAFATCP